MKKNLKKGVLCLLLSSVLVILGCMPVLAANTTVKLSRTKATMYKGQTGKLRVKVSGTQGTVKWSSSNPSVAVVSANGKVTAKKAGNVLIKATVNEVSKTCKIKVKNPTLKLNKKSATLYSNVSSKKTLQLKASVKGASKKVKWYTSNKAVATVSNGKVTAKAPGKVNITARANGKVAKCVIVVKKKSTAGYAKAGLYSKEYSVSTSGYQVTANPSNCFIVAGISGNKIKFVVEHYGVNGSPIYTTNTITATIKNNKVSRFNWVDSWGNRGYGSLSFGKSRVTVKMKTTHSASSNRWGWYSSETMSYERKLTSSEKKWYVNTGVEKYV